MSTTRFKKTMLRPEQAMQKQLIQLRDLYAGQVPELRRLFAVPNGGYRTDAEAGILKGMGQVAGVPDLELPVLNSSYTGLHIELKDPGETASDEQRDWITFLRSQRRCVQTCESVDAAWLVICWYLSDRDPSNRHQARKIAKEGGCRFARRLWIHHENFRVFDATSLVFSAMNQQSLESFITFALTVGVKFAAGAKEVQLKTDG